MPNEFSPSSNYLTVPSGKPVIASRAAGIAKISDGGVTPGLSSGMNLSFQLGDADPQVLVWLALLTADRQLHENKEAQAYSESYFLRHLAARMAENCRGIDLLESELASLFRQADDLEALEVAAKGDHASLKIERERLAASIGCKEENGASAGEIEAARIELALVDSQLSQVELKLIEIASETEACKLAVTVNEEQLSIEKSLEDLLAVSLGAEPFEARKQVISSQENTSSVLKELNREGVRIAMEMTAERSRQDRLLRQVLEERIDEKALGEWMAASSLDASLPGEMRLDSGRPDSEVSSISSDGIVSRGVV